ncbi:arouser isoform 2-T6 [Cochliomyia hominivorax]
MSYPHSNGGGGIIDAGSHRGYSGDERESRSGGEDGGGSIGHNDDSDIIVHDKPTYLLEHLATFTVNKDSGIVYPADGMRRLLQLEKTTGIWSQKMQLCLDYHWVLIMDYETGNIIERFPASLIQEPTAFTSTDAMELYNNILVFIVSGGNGSRSEMHIFQSQSVSAVHLVEDLKNLQRGNCDLQQRELMTLQGNPRHSQKQQQLPHTINTHSQVYMDSNSNSGSFAVIARSKNTHYEQQSGYSIPKEQQQSYSMRHENDNIAMGMVETDSDHGGLHDSRAFSGVNLNDETSSVSSDKYERDVNVLNHCFDDIEKFIARLQHAAAASRELERRRRNRKSKKKDPGEGLLTLRTRPPHEKEFIDIFAKFKLSFNLLAKLKTHIHDPNAPELVHFLFTPLALIVEAASDTYYESQLPGRVIKPLLTREAVNLLINCVTSKETELWRSLGDAWTVPRDQWKDDVGSYHPVFLDGWSPDYLIIDELEKPVAMTPPPPAIVSNSNKRSYYAENGREVALDMADNSGSTLHDNIIHSYDDCDGSSDKYNIENTIEIKDRYSEVVMSYSDHHTNTKNHSNVALTMGTSADAGTSGIQAITSGVQNLYNREIRPSVHGSVTEQVNSSSSPIAVNHAPELSTSVRSGDGDEMVEQWLDELQAAGAKIVLVTYPRTANNDKELSVVRGEYLEILDDSRKWWKARNIRGQIAHVPHTIVTPYNCGDMESTKNQNIHAGYIQQNLSYSKTRNSNPTDNFDSRTSSNGNADWIRNKHLVLYPKSTTTNPKISDSSTNTCFTVQEELKLVLGQRERRSDIDFMKTVNNYIDQKSSQSEVVAWLKAKGFSSNLIKRINGLNAEELFALSRERILEICGCKEGKRLASQLYLQKSVSGYKSARSAELNSILAKARPKTEISNIN